MKELTAQDAGARFALTLPGWLNRPVTFHLTALADAAAERVLHEVLDIGVERDITMQDMKTALSSVKSTTR